MSRSDQLTTGMSEEGFFKKTIWLYAQMSLNNIKFVSNLTKAAYNNEKKEY